LKFSVDELEVLGKGQFGTVYKGKISGSMDIVAFKTPNREQVSATYLKNLLQEIKIMIYIGHHENVVKLIGAHTQKIREGKHLNFLLISPVSLLDLRKSFYFIRRVVHCLGILRFGKPGGPFANNSKNFYDSRRGWVCGSRRKQTIGCKICQ